MDDTLPAALAADLDGAFERLVHGHQDRLYSIALRLLRDARDAEEVAQDAFVRAYKALAAWEPDRIRAVELRPWLATIVVNLCRNRARRHRPTLVSIHHGDETDGAPRQDVASLDRREIPHDELIRRETAERWAGLIAGLPDRYRVPVVLRHVDGLSYEEMATVLGRPEGTIKAQVHRGLMKLRVAAEQAALVEREEMSA
jgi:RNA polymerase sigma factor (sigma-70 family)